MGRLTTHVCKNINTIYKLISMMDLKKRLIALITIAVLVPVIITSMVSISYCKNILKHEARVMEFNTIQQISQSIDEMLKGQINKVADILLYDDMIYEYLVERKYDPETDQRKKMIDTILLSEEITSQYMGPGGNIKIAAFYSKNGEFFNISFPPADTDIVIPKVKEMAEASKKNNLVIQWYPLQNNFFNGKPTQDSRQNYVNIASRALFQPYTNEYMGTLIFTIAEKQIYNQYDTINLGNLGKIFIINSNGELISHVDEKNFTTGIKDSALKESILKNTDMDFTYWLNGLEVLVVKKKSDFNGWITVGVVPLRELFGNINRIFSIIVWIVFIVLIFSIAYVIFVVDRIVKPIRKIIKTMSEVENGNLNARAKVKGEYEISNLAKYFNRMVEKVDQLIKKEYVLEKKKKEAELNVLMSQINSHFLYNTLESIVWKARMVGEIEISNMASSLGRLFRIAINKGNLMVTVDEEIEHMEAYLEIQKVRYLKNFQHTVSFMDEKLHNYKMLKLLLQPIVENALFHGMNQQSDRFLISITIMELRDKLILEVADNGVGIPIDILIKLNGELIKKIELSGIDKQVKKEYRGIGLKNINERIKLYFGEEYGIQVDSLQGEGTTVRIELPLLEVEDYI